MIYDISIRDTIGFWNDLFDDNELNKIIKLGKSIKPEKGVLGISGASREEIDKRSSDISWIHRQQHTEWIFRRYDGAVNRLNTLLFHVDVQHLEYLQFTTYHGSGDHYDWHWDMHVAPPPNVPEIAQQRKISIVTQLSDPEEYEGGILQLAPCGIIQDVPREKGNTAVFLSFVNHRVTPVTKGTRYSLVGWCEGPDWR